MDECAALSEEYSGREEEEPENTSLVTGGVEEECSYKSLTEKDIDSNHSIYDKDYYDSDKAGKCMDIRFQEENLRQDLEDYFEVRDTAEGPEILADMFLDKRICEMTEKELKDLFYRHGYVLYLHHKIADGLLLLCLFRGK